MKQKEVKTGSVKAVLGKRPLKSRGVGGREVRIRWLHNDKMREL